MAGSYSDKYLVILLVVIFSCGCSLLGTNNRDEVKLQTNRDSYTVDSETVIQMTVTNSYDNTIYYICTGQIYLEELEERRVVDTWLVHGFEQCLRRSPVEVDQSHSFEISFENSFLDEMLKNAQFTESVDYRFRMDLFETEEVDQLLDKKDRLSNKFKIIQE